MEMHGRRGSRNTLLVGSHVRGGDQHFRGTEYLCWVYTTQKQQGCIPIGATCSSHRGIHHPETTGLYTFAVLNNPAEYGIHHPEITGLYTGAVVIYEETQGIHHPEITGFYTKVKSIERVH